MPSRDGYTTIELKDNTQDILKIYKGTATYDQAILELMAKARGENVCLK